MKTIFKYECIKIDILSGNGAVEMASGDGSLPSPN